MKRLGVWLQLGLAVLLSIAAVGRCAPVLEVGRVTLTIGASELQRAGQSQPIKKGDGILAGDLIQTGDSGHVHIRFEDGALVSVRPNSLLRVDEYRVDRAHPAQSSVRFTLEQGVARAISGAAAQAAHERFRLNTPLVAIGVKGTDFTTLSDATRTVVVVNQGAIVLAPLDAQCSAAALGPCASPRARELTATMTNTALVYHHNAPEPGFQPLNTLKGSDQLRPVMQQERQGSGNVTYPLAESQAPTSLAAFVPQQSDLTWGRWPTQALPGDALTQSFMAAFQGRQITVGDGYYFLFRNETGSNLLPTLTGQASFTLQSSTAYYRSAGNLYSPATVQGGSLTLDFSRNTFNTQISATSMATGPQTISASGALNASNGLFLSSTADTHVAGAVSFNSLQAGYFFNHFYASGAALSGATLWGR